MDIFSKLKDVVQSHIPSKSAGATDIRASDSGLDKSVDDILKSDSTSDLSKSSKVLEASANADYSGGLGQTVGQSPASVQPAMSDVSSVPQQSSSAQSVPASDVPVPPSNPMQDAYPQDQTAIAQAAFPPLQNAADNANLNQQPASLPFQSQMQSQQQAQPVQPLSAGSATAMPGQAQSLPVASVPAMPEYPQGSNPISDMQQTGEMSTPQKIDINIELKEIKSQINLIIEKLNVIEERTRRTGY
ncbi:MAG: hypothetical protein U9P44_02165 [archaeon]|nr:hypothetical protein [archaeon]